MDLANRVSLNVIGVDVTQSADDKTAAWPNLRGRELITEALPERVVAEGMWDLAGTLKQMIHTGGRYGIPLDRTFMD